MAKKKKPEFIDGKFYTKKEEAKIINYLRLIFTRSFLRRSGLKNYRKRIDGVYFYRCKSCDLYYEKIYMDHIKPVGSKKIQNWEEYVSSIFCNPANLQPLCKDCHDEKTKLDKEQIKKDILNNGKPRKNQIRTRRLQSSNQKIN